MQIEILLEDKTKLEVKVKINEDIEDLKYLIDDEIEENEKSINYYQMVNENIILNDKKQIIQFYNFSQSKVVKIGKLENFLSDGDVIVELIIHSVSNSDCSYKETTLVHLIINENSSVSNIKSNIEHQLNQLSLFKIELFDMKGNQLENDYTINNYGMNGYFRFFIIPSNNFRNFEYYCKKYDRFLVDYYLRNNDLTYLWYRNEFNECRVDGLKDLLNYAKKLVSANNNKTYLDKNFPKIGAFMNCRFLFCDVMTNQICEVCDDFYWRREIERCGYDEVVVSVFRQYFRDAVRIEIIENVKTIIKNPQVYEKSMKSIVIDALDYCLKYLVYPTRDWRHLIRSFFGEFAFEFVSNSELEGIIDKWGEDHSTIIIPCESIFSLSISPIR